MIKNRRANDQFSDFSTLSSSFKKSEAATTAALSLSAAPAVVSAKQSLMVRLAALRQNQQSSALPGKAESPRYLPPPPRRAETLTNALANANSNNPPSPTTSRKSDHTASSPTLNRRRLSYQKVGSGISMAPSPATATAPLSPSFSPIGVASPKYLPKAEVDSSEVLKFPSQIQPNTTSEMASTIFSSSITTLSAIFKSSSIKDKQVPTIIFSHLKEVSTCFGILQREIHAAQLSLNSFKLEKSQFIEEFNRLRESKETEVLHLKDQNLKLKMSLESLQNQLNEYTSSLSKEKANVEFLQNYMEEIVIKERDSSVNQPISLKDGLCQRISQLEGEILVLQSSQCSLSTKEAAEDQISELARENSKLKETVKLLELERSSTKSFCQKAIEVLDAQAQQNDSSHPALHTTEEIHQLKDSCSAKQIEIEKLKAREQHYRESNEIFQQKLQLLTEENRRLRGQRPSNLY